MKKENVDVICAFSAENRQNKGEIACITPLKNMVREWGMLSLSRLVFTAVVYSLFGWLLRLDSFKSLFHHIPIDCFH